jgi:hypothetical protein
VPDPVGAEVAVRLDVTLPVGAGDRVTVILGVSVELGVPGCVGVCVRVAERVSDAVTDAVPVSVAVRLGDEVCDELWVWLAVSVWLGDVVCDRLLPCVLLADGVKDCDCDAVIDWLGLREVVCEALGAHVCWIAESRIARNEDSVAHVPAPSVDKKLA